MIGWTSRTIFLSLFEHFAWAGVKLLHIGRGVQLSSHGR
jgi:hypothetical protein